MKKLIKLAWDELVRGGFFTSVCALATLYSFSIISGKSVTPVFALIVFLITISIYFYNFIGEVNEDLRDDHEEQKYVKKHKFLYYLLIGVSIVLSLYLVLKFGSTLSIYFTFIFIILGILYTKGLKQLSKIIPGFKDIFVILCWNLLAPFFYIFHSYQFDAALLVFMLFALSRDWVDANYSDLKDIRVDKNDGLKTFANILGVNKLMNSIYISSFISVVIIVLGTSFNFFPNFALILILPIISTLIFIMISRKIKNYSTLFVDSEAFLWLILLYFLK